MPDFRALVSVFEDALLFASRSGNDFSWSGWEDAADARRELEPTIEKLKREEMPSSIQLWFLPTGPFQELAIQSGWGDDFLLLADRFDAAMAFPCICLEPKDPHPLLEFQSRLGLDLDLGDVETLRCKLCHRIWIRYALEDEAFTGSGRWYLGPAPGPFDLESARSAFEQMEFYFCGGSYFGGGIHCMSGPIP